MKTVVAFVLLVLLSGCAVVCYVRIGPQKAKKIKVVIEGQEADPNIPKGMFDVDVVGL